MIGPGQKAPDFQIPQLGGGQKSLSEALAQSPVLLVFFKISCPTCQFTLPFLERLNHAGNKPFQMFLISQDDASRTRALFAEHNITVPTLLDPIPEYPASNAYQLRSVPSMFMVGSDGVVQAAQTGFNRDLIREWGLQSGIEVFQSEEKVPASKYG